MDKKLTQEELNLYHQELRKQYEGEEIISEILTENTNKFEIDEEEENEESFKQFNEAYTDRFNHTSAQRMTTNI